MARSAKRALIESVKSDIDEEARATSVSDEHPFTAEEFFDGLDVDALFGDALEISIARDLERDT